jgi:hypothetical protein
MVIVGFWLLEFVEALRPARDCRSALSSFSLRRHSARSVPNRDGIRATVSVNFSPGYG